MSFKDDFLDVLNSEIESEEGLKRLYEKYSSEMKDESLRLRLREVILGRETQTRMLKDILKIVGGYDTLHGSYIFNGEVEKLMPYLGNFTGSSNIILSTSSKNYPTLVDSTVKCLVNLKGISCVYVSLIQPIQSLRQMFTKEGIFVEKIRFIESNAIPVSPDSIPPQNLTELSIRIEKELDALEGSKVVIFDTLSTLFLYNPQKMVEEFIVFQNKLCKINSYAIAWIDVGSKEYLISETAKAFCDRFIEVEF